MALDKIMIDSTNYATIKAWFDAGRGVTVWENQEIASGAARQVFTPGDHKEPPNWRYGNRRDLAMWDLMVEHFEVLETFRGRFKAMYWGPWVAKGTEAKAIRLCKKHGQPDTSWRWEADDMPGYVKVSIGRTVLVPFENEKGGQL